MFFRFSDAATRDTAEFASIIEHLNERPKPPQPKKPDPNWENYQYGLSAWRNDYLQGNDSLQGFEPIERMVIQLAPGDPDAQNDWLWNRTHTEIAQAYAETLMFKRD